jgi:hypothetical protein
MNDVRGPHAPVGINEVHRLRLGVDSKRFGTAKLLVMWLVVFKCDKLTAGSQRINVER